MEDKEIQTIGRWRILKGHILSTIKEINEDTPWQEKEPDWWLEMMEIQRILMNSKI